MKRLLPVLLAALLVPHAVAAQAPHFEGAPGSQTLIVDGNPYLILGGETSNSAATSVHDIRSTDLFPKLRAMGLNTVLVPVYWDLTEPEEGSFDFTLVDTAIEEARRSDLRLVLLWFGAWKNSMSCYAPLWFKQDTRRFPPLPDIRRQAAGNSQSLLRGSAGG